MPRLNVSISPRSLMVMMPSMVFSRMDRRNSSLRPPLCQVAANVCETQMLPAVIIQRGNRGNCPEGRAILAHAKPFDFIKSPVQEHSGAPVARHALRNGLLRIKTREMLPDDLPGRGYPLSRSAPGFQLATMPAGSSRKMPYSVTESIRKR